MVLPAACVAESCAFLVGYFLVSAVVLGRVDCSVCHSFTEISVGVCVCQNICATYQLFGVAGIQFGILYPGFFLVLFGRGWCCRWCVG